MSALDEIGINQQQSSRWQRMAAVSPDGFARWLAEIREDGGEITEAGLFVLAAETARTRAGRTWTVPASRETAAPSPPDDGVPRNAVLLGDCLDRLRELPENSVDAVITDPPYAIGFLGREFDTFTSAHSFQEWCRQWGVECLRVLKPGGHLLAFGGTRTYHRLTSGLEDAGFEIRDTVAWLYGSGFPKSLNVSAALDRIGGLLPDEERFCGWMREHSGISAQRAKRILGSDRFITGEIAVVNTATKENPRFGRRAMVPTAAAWERIRPLLAVEPPLWVEDLVKHPPAPPVEHPGDWKPGRGLGTTGTNQWAGFGTNLKPAFEPVVVARKPLAATTATTVLAYGTGALNIGGCRVGTGSDQAPGGNRGQPHRDVFLGGDGPADHSLGRWPANVVLDETAAAVLDEQSGTRPSAPCGSATTTGSRDIDEPGEFDYTGRGYSDAGGASRFFATFPDADPDDAVRFRYCPKASRSDRTGSLTGIAGREGQWGNDHPTVKPNELMRWLCRLVGGRPGSLILDPFGGSGSTGIAARLEGMDYLLIERDPEFCRLARQRLGIG